MSPIRTLERLTLFLFRMIPLSREIKGSIRRAGMHFISSSTFSLGALAVITDGEGRVLLFHHTYREEYPWGLPGGGVSRESLGGALEREISEESDALMGGSGYLINVENLIGLAHDGRHRLNFIYACSIAGGSFHTSDEVDKCDWFALDRLPDLVPSERLILDTITMETGEGLRLDTRNHGYFNHS